MRLGEFDPPDMVPYNKINTSVIQSPEHQELAIKTAMRTFVLMKNKGNILPLKQKIKTLGVSIVWSAFSVVTRLNRSSLLNIVKSTLVHNK